MSKPDPRCDEACMFICSGEAKQALAAANERIRELELLLAAQKQEWSKAYDIGVTCKHHLSDEQLSEAKRIDSLLARVAVFESLETKRMKDAVTADDWRRIAEHMEYQWRCCSEGFNTRAGQLKDQITAERDHARQCLDNAVQLLVGIHALLYPPRTTDSKGATFVFHSPHVHEQMQELSDRIRALPDEVAAIRARG